MVHCIIEKALHVANLNSLIVKCHGSHIWEACYFAGNVDRMGSNTGQRGPMTFSRNSISDMVAQVGVVTKIFKM